MFGLAMKTIGTQDGVLSSLPTCPYPDGHGSLECFLVFEDVADILRQSEQPWLVFGHDLHGISGPMSRPPGWVR